ncbi:MAG: hypothetical protein SFY68_06520 [Candidatus Sumerlaeia bacterium]|nr:hypothetical protein [Candidatus Sumerlaeia bacterium]
MELDFPQSAYEIGDRIPFSLRFEEPVTGITKLTVRPHETQEKLLRFPVSPTTKDGVTWQGEFQVLSDIVDVVQPFDISLTLTPALKLSAESTTQTLEMVPLLSEATSPPGYLDPKIIPLEWQGVLLLFAIIAIVSLLLLALLIWAWFRIVRPFITKKLDAYEQRTTPIQLLEQDFERLKSLELLQTKGVEPHYTLLSFVLRRYLESTGHMKALELTDDELEQLIQTTASDQPVKFLKGLFVECSAAKYAQSQYSEALIKSHLAIVQEFLHAEKLRLIKLEQEQKASERGGKRSKEVVA